MPNPTLYTSLPISDDPTVLSSQNPDEEIPRALRPCHLVQTGDMTEMRGFATSDVTEFMTDKDKITLKLIDDPRVKKRPAPYASAKSIVRRNLDLISRNTQATSEATEKFYQFMTLNQLNLVDRHHLLKSIVKNKQDNSFQTFDVTGQGIYDVAAKSHQFENVREAHGIRNYDQKQRISLQVEHNKECRMKRSDRVQCMIESVKEDKREHITLTMLTNTQTKRILQAKRRKR